MKLSIWDPLKEMEDVFSRYLKPLNRQSMGKQDLLPPAIGRHGLISKKPIQNSW